MYEPEISVRFGGALRKRLRLDDIETLVVDDASRPEGRWSLNGPCCASHVTTPANFFETLVIGVLGDVGPKKRISASQRVTYEGKPRHGVAIGGGDGKGCLSAGLNN